MRIDCLHGFFLFEEHSAGEISRFASKFGLSLARRSDGRFTFTDILETPTFSMPGLSFHGNDPSVVFEGEPWEVFKANGLVYDFTEGQVVPIDSIKQRTAFNECANYFVADGLILPGSLTSTGKRVTDFSGWMIWSSSKFRYTEVSYAETV